jgi:hypothetical protein
LFDERFAAKIGNLPPYSLVRQRARFHLLEIIKRQRMQPAGLEALNKFRGRLNRERSNIGGT